MCNEEYTCHWIKCLVLFAVMATVFTSYYFLHFADFEQIFEVFDSQDFVIKDKQRDSSAWRVSLQYKWGNTSGIPFLQAAQYINSLVYPLPRFVKLTSNIVNDFVFVTAASDDHFEEAQVLIWTLRKKCGPSRLLVFYDLGLNETNKNKVHCWEGVEYQYVNRSRYPGHVSNLHLYAWKPLIILDALRRYPAVFWLDSSVRIKSANLTPLFNHVIQNGGLCLLAQASHTNAAVTHPYMYKYIPTDEGKQRHTPSYTSTMFLVNTQYTFTHILWWYILCALEKMCIAPTKQRYCSFSKKTVPCHRFDMSLINLLLSNDYNFKPENYGIANASSLLSIIRGDVVLPSNQSHLSDCSNGLVKYTE